MLCDASVWTISRLDLDEMRAEMLVNHKHNTTQYKSGTSEFVIMAGHYHWHWYPLPESSFDLFSKSWFERLVNTHDDE